MTVDLHLHTYHSDGTWSPAELVERAVELKLKHIAVTDHDTVSGIDEARAACRGRVEIIPGIEINTVMRDSGGACDVHILGYFIDVSNPELKRLLDRQRQARLKLVDDTITLLSQLGIEMTREQVSRCAGRGSIGRPHITRAIVEAGGAADVAEAYEKFMTRGAPYYVDRQSVSPAEAVEAINSAGGIASIAHPGNPERMKDIIVKLKACGLKAVEAYHRRHSIDEVRYYIRFAHREGLAVTGGSDCHGPFQDHAASIGSISVPREVVARLERLRLSPQAV